MRADTRVRGCAGQGAGRGCEARVEDAGGQGMGWGAGWGRDCIDVLLDIIMHLLILRNGCEYTKIRVPVPGAAREGGADALMYFLDITVYSHTS